MNEERQFLISMYSSKMRDAARKLESDPPEFDIENIDATIRYLERKIRTLIQIKEYKKILLVLTKKI